jgi:hypothetical protein
VLTVLAIAGCGGGSTGPGTTNPTASAPEATAPPTDATQPGTAPTTMPPATTTAPPRTQTEPAGGGGEQAVRVPASFVVTQSGRLTPPTITVPPFLAVEISIRSDDGRPHRLVLQTPALHTLQVAAGKRAAVRIAGLRAGRYPVTLDGSRAGALVAGGEVGP